MVNHGVLLVALCALIRPDYFSFSPAMTIAEHKITAGKFTWFYRESCPARSGGDVVLLHGIPSQSYCWGEIMPSLGEQGWRAIAPDWLGFGKSDWPDNRDFKYTPDAFIQELGMFFEALEMSQFSLVVQGFLGTIGLQYALRNPERINRLVILNAPLTPQMKLPWQMRQWTIPLAGEMMTQDPLLVDRTLEKGSGYRIEDQYLDVYRRPFLQSSAAGRSLLATVKNLQLTNSTTEISRGLGQLSKPILVVWGMQDPWLDFQEVETLSSTCQQMQINRLPEAGHYPQEHWSGQISDLVLPFLRRQF